MRKTVSNQEVEVILNAAERIEVQDFINSVGNHECEIVCHFYDSQNVEYTKKLFLGNRMFFDNNTKEHSIWEIET